MMRLAVLVLLAFSLGAAAPRLISVEPAMASPGAELVASGDDLTEVALLFLTVGPTDIEVEVLEKSAETIRFRLPADVAHGQYRLMLQTGGDAPALLVQPVMCEVMDAAAIAEREAEEEAEQRRIDAAAAPPEPPAETP